MIITTIKIHGRSQKRQEIIQTIKGLADQMVQFDGCNNANFYQDIANKDIFYLIEEWKAVGDLEKYLKSKSIAVLFGLESLLSEPLEIRHAVNYLKCNKIMAVHLNRRKIICTCGPLFTHWRSMSRTIQLI